MTNTCAVPFGQNTCSCQTQPTGGGYCVYGISGDLVTPENPEPPASPNKPDGLHIPACPIATFPIN